MLNRDFDCLTVNGACDLTTKDIIAGSPLTQNADGTFRLAKVGDPFVGLSFNYYHTGKNDVTGGEWFADSGKLGIVKIAQVTLEADEIDGEKVSPFVLPTSDNALNYTPGDKLVVDSTGKLTVAGSDDADAVATVVAFDAQKGALTIFVNAKN